MTLLLGTPTERLHRHLGPNCAQEVTTGCTLVNLTKPGRARIDCRLRDGDHGWRCHLDPKLLPTPANASRFAEGVVLVRHTHALLTAHILAYEPTTAATKLDADLKPQLVGSLLRLHALTGIAGLTITDAVLYVAYRSDRTREDPILSKLPIDDALPPAARRELQRRREWLREQPLALPGLDPDKILFKRIQLVENPDDPDEAIADILLQPRA